MMKRHIIFLLSTLFLMTDALSTWGNPIRPQQAQQIANRYAVNKTPLTRVKVARFELQATSAVPKANAKANTNAETNASIYIFSRGANKGFVIISGDDSMPEVLGVVEEGDWDETSMPPALLEWLESRSEMVKNAQELGLPRHGARTYQGTRNIGPLITTRWNQKGPYNIIAPIDTTTNKRAVTGCSATAASQLVHYWHNELNDFTLLDTPTYDGQAPVTKVIPAGTPFKWKLMLDKYNNTSDPIEMQNAVATLMYVIGTTAHVKYASAGTSGNAGKVANALEAQLNVSLVHKDKSKFSQDEWEKLMYTNLDMGRPMFYRGSNKDNSGHAFNLDGYRVSDHLFHFNFGWGGSGDGYFSVSTDSTAAKGYYKSQGAIYDFMPLKRKVKVTLNLQDNLLQHTGKTPLYVTLTNNSVAPYTGVKVYCSTRTSVGGIASIVDTKTRFEPGETKTVEYSLPSATTAYPYNIFITDQNLNLLAELRDVYAAPQQGELFLEKFEVSSSEVVNNVHHVHNNHAIVTAHISNCDTTAFCEPTLICYLDTPSADAYAMVDSIKIANIIVRKGEPTDFVFDFKKLNPEKEYRVRLLSMNAQLNSTPVGADSILAFRVFEPSLKIDSCANLTAYLSGYYDAELFATLANNNSICNYDLTAVHGRVQQPKAANANALFIVHPDSTAYQGTNIICNGICHELQLVPGCNFAPLSPFTATKASFTPKASTARWASAVIPFNATCPEKSFIARQIYAVSDSRVTNSDSTTFQLHSCTPFLYMTSTEAPIEIVATDVLVSTTAENMGTDSLCANWMNIIATNAQYVLNNTSTQYFVAVTDSLIPAFTPYLALAKRIAATQSEWTTKDIYNKKLSTALVNAEVVLAETQTTADSETWKTTSDLVSDASQLFAKQPIAADINTATNDVNKAIETLQGTIVNITPEGWKDYTNRIVNPSFELALSNGWTVQKEVGVTVSTSTTSTNATFMANTIGSKILKMTYKDGVAAASISQEITNLESGYYKLVVGVGVESQDNHFILEASTEEHQRSECFEGSIFGPMYLIDAAIDSIPVTNGQLTIRLAAMDGWVKADNFRLYRIGDITTIVQDLTEADEHERQQAAGIFDLAGRKIDNKKTNVSRLPNGIYIINGKKIIK